MMKTSALLIFFLFSSYLGATLPLRSPPFVPPPDEQNSRWNPKVIKALSLGNTPLLADWIWMKILVDPAMHPTPKGTHPPLYYDLDLLTRLDPRHQDAYIGGGNLLSIVRSDYDGAVDILKRGHHFVLTSLESYSESFRQRHWPTPSLVSIGLIYNYLFELQDLPSAATIIREAATVPGAPEYLERQKDRLEKDGGEYEVGLRLLNFLIQSNQDERIRSTLIEKRKNLFLGQFLFETNKHFQQYLDSMPQYRNRLQLPPKTLAHLWRQFIRETRASLEDPFGGRLFLDQSGRISSTTPYEPVFNLK